MFLIPKFIILRSLFPFLAFLIIWEMVRKGIAMYKAGKQKEIWRFVCIFIFNTFGLLPIIYLLVDSLKTNNVDSTNENNKINNEIKKQPKTTLKGGVKKWESATPVKRQKGTLKDSLRKKTTNTPKK